MAENEESAGQPNMEPVNTESQPTGGTFAEESFYSEIEEQDIPGDPDNKRNPRVEDPEVIGDRDPNKVGTEPEKEENSDSTSTESPAVETKTDTSSEEPVKDSEAWQSEITLQEGEVQVNLKKVKFSDGTFGYVPADKAAGVMMEADYRKKTADLATERKTIKETYEKESEVIVLENLAHYIGATVDKESGKMVVGEFLEPAPLESDYVVSTEPEDRDKEKDDYRKALNDWSKKKNLFEDRKRTFYQNFEATVQENSRNMEEFNKTLGKEYGITAEEVMAEARPYIRPSISKGQKPFPADTLKIFYLGKHFDELVASKVSKAKLDAVNEIENATKKNAKGPAVKNITPKKERQKEVERPATHDATDDILDDLEAGKQFSSF